MQRKSDKPRFCQYCINCKEIGTERFSVYRCMQKDEFVHPLRIGCNLWKSGISDLPEWVRVKIIKQK